jgi:hypothetical protein
MHITACGFKEVGRLQQVQGALPVAVGAAVLLDQVVHEVDGQHGARRQRERAREAADARAELHYARALHAAQHAQHLGRAACKLLSRRR